MILSWQLSLSLAKYLIKNRLNGRKRFPLILMLEPTLRCNLACAGCGRIREYKDTLTEMLSVDECMAAVDESGAPVVSITGGEPLLHPGIGQIVEGSIARKRFTNLCTNGLLLKESLSKFKPNPYFSFVLHLDGLAETHDKFACREGVFDNTIEVIKAAKQAGFQVRTNTTIYKGTNLEEIREVFTLLSKIPVDGIIVTPAFNYEEVNTDVFLSHSEIVDALKPVYEMRKQFRFYNTPIYLEFLAGKRDLKCVPWSNPTRNPKGWKSPCYLITDQHYPTFKELMEKTQWEKYGTNNDQRCANCMVHCGFEASSIEEINSSLVNFWRILKWNFLNR